MSELVSPPESVTLAVIVCVPTDRPVEKNPPEPIEPSRFELQARLLVKLPSSKSLAQPWKFKVATEVYVLPSAGEVIVTVGGVLNPPTVIVILSESGNPPESLTEAVIVCVPTERPVEKEPPEPIEPSMLEVQTRLAARFPS
jgi:hypothetical protein